MPEFSIESIDFGSPWALLVIAVAAIIQDDLTCLVVGSAVAAGEVEPLPAAAACLIGISLGDVGWFISARLIGRKVLTLWPFRVIVSEEKIRKGRERFERMGGGALFASRFLPVLRTPLQVVSGMLGGPILSGCGVLLVAGMIYVTLFIGTGTAVGQSETVRGFYDHYGAMGLVVIPLGILATAALVRSVMAKRAKAGKEG